MADLNLITVDNLGPEFDIGQTVPGKITVNLNAQLEVDKLPLFEYRDLWAEESSSLQGVSAEWSYGNGATGFMGIPFDSGWELVQMAFMADTFASLSTVRVDLMSYNTPSNAAANTIAQIELVDARDGQGDTNNAHKVQNYTGVIVPAGVVGFITRQRTGNVSDGRIYARFKRQIGEYVSDVSLR